jgi:hypothetical protein
MGLASAGFEQLLSSMVRGSTGKRARTKETYPRKGIVVDFYHNSHDGARCSASGPTLVNCLLSCEFRL